MRIDLALLFTCQVAKLKNSVTTNLLIWMRCLTLLMQMELMFLKIINTMDENTNVFVISHKGEILYDKFQRTNQVCERKKLRSKIETV